MKRIHKHLLTFIVFTILFYFTGCNEKPNETESSLPVEDTTELIVAAQTQDLPQKTVTPKCVPASSSSQEEKKELVQEKEKPIQKVKLDLSETYSLTGVNNEAYKLSLGEEKVFLHDSEKPLILIHLFDPNNEWSIAQAPYLSKLQEEYMKRLTVIAMPTSEALTVKELSSWAQTHQAEYFISVNQESIILSNKLSEELNITISPTTLLYHNGENYSIYEGATPIEMITHDILQTGK